MKKNHECTHKWREVSKRLVNIGTWRGVFVATPVYGEEVILACDKCGIIKNIPNRTKRKTNEPNTNY